MTNIKEVWLLLLRGFFANCNGTAVHRVVTVSNSTSFRHLLNRFCSLNFSSDSLHKLLKLSVLLCKFLTFSQQVRHVYFGKSSPSKTSIPPKRFNKSIIFSASDLPPKRKTFSWDLLPIVFEQHLHISNLFSLAVFFGVRSGWSCCSAIINHRGHYTLFVWRNLPRKSYEKLSISGS